MLLALDIGNSAAKGGLFDGADLVNVFSMAPGSERSESPDAAAWADALRPHLDGRAVARVGLVSVVPAATAAVTEALSRLTDAPVVHVGPDCSLPFTLAYDTPETLGHDRLAAAAAGWIRYGRDESRSVLVVDAGTAVNYEVIHRDGIYQGGAIDAGPGLVRQALRTGTAQLPEAPLTLPETPVGASTQTALQSGIMWGFVGSVRGMRTRLAQSLPDSPELVLTGGWGGLLADHLEAATHHAPHLVLRGVRLLTLMNR